MNWTKAFWGLIGFLWGVTLTLTIATHQIKKMTANTDASLQTLQANFEQMKALHQQAAEQWQACEQQRINLFNDSTVILEPLSDDAQSSAVRVLAGKIWPSVIQGEHGRPSSIRWFIQGRVAPMVYDEPRGARYGYIDKDGKFEGWFTPRQVQ